MQSGNLVLKPIDAQLTHNTELIGKMSPYLKVILGNESKSTQAAKKMHFKPVWDAELVFRYHGEMNLRVEIWNKEMLSKDDLVGHGTLDLSSIIGSGQFQGQVPLYFKEKDAGFLNLSINFFPDSSQYSPFQSQVLTNRPVDLGLAGGSYQTGQQSTFLNQQLPSQQYQNQQYQSQQFQKVNNYETQFLNQSLPTTGYGINETTFLPQSGVNTQINTQRSTQILPQTQTTVLTGNLEPIYHKETTRITEQPIYVSQRPVVHEKTIIIEKPIITEKTIIEKEIPIIRELPELRETSYYQKVEPVVIREQPTVFRQDIGVGVANLRLEGEPIITRQTEVRREEPVYRVEQAELYQKEVVYERPIIHEKDITFVEKPIWVERPEIREYPIMRNEGSQLFTEALLRREVVADQLNVPEALIHSQRVVVQENPVFVKERPEIFENEVVIDKPIIHEQPVIYTEKQEIHEMPEFIEKRGFKLEQPIVEKLETVYVRNDSLRTETVRTETLRTDNLRNSAQNFSQQQQQQQHFNQMTDLA